MEQPSIEEDPSVFGEDSMSGIESELGTRVGHTFSARIIVTDGTNNTCITDVIDSPMDTTHDLSVASSAEGNNELMMIMNVDGPDLEEVGMEEIDLPDATATKSKSQVKKEFSDTTTKIGISIILVMLGIFFMMLIFYVTGVFDNGGDKDDAASQLAAIDTKISTESMVTIEPSMDGIFDFDTSMSPTEELFDETGSPTELVLTAAPTGIKTGPPTPVPTKTPSPTPVPTKTPSSEPTLAPTVSPTSLPTPDPTKSPTPRPSALPSLVSTSAPTLEPEPALASFTIIPTPVQTSNFIANSPAPTKQGVRVILLD